VLLSELIQEDLVKMDLEASNKWDAIEELVDLLISSHELRLTNRAEVVDTVFAREKSLSTGLEHGLAVPHGAVECVGDILAAVGLSKNGIPFDSLDGNPARLVVLLVIPKGAAQRHVRTLAGIARLASNQGLRQRILEAQSHSEILEAIYILEQEEESAGQD
jgi:mannitol/fructose-specific phosphotransferase system IIA component (Ntr-type)